jgi:homopolymeric O-antigen transport system ATP-binding protein
MSSAVPDVAIEARNLTKIYRLYARPHYRFLDLFGLLRSNRGRWTEHRALDSIDLTIKRGEKVALIGRNGAGKSTFLKIVSGVVEPTAGEIEVTGVARALLSIGAGFHPEFTGRENASSYLAHMGIGGARAAPLLDEIVEFAEIEEYIDQPLKTYSSGMAARLMFATSTVIAPDLLVLDEVLSVGDAYFVHKSFERIKTLCAHRDTTLLFVSHDVYSAAAICERMIWLDRGRMIMDGPSPDVVKAYENSIREQEERRLRLKKLKSLAERGVARAAEPRRILVEIAAAGGSPLPAPVHFSRVALYVDGAAVGGLPLGAGAFADKDSHLLAEAGCWGEPETVAGRLARPMLHYGSPFHKVAGVVDATGMPFSADTEIALEVDAHAAAPCRLVAKVFVGDKPLAGALSLAGGQWEHHALALGSASGAGGGGRNASVDATGRFGTGRIWITDLAIRNGEGAPSFILSHGQPVEILLAFEVRDPSLDEKPQVLLAFHRDGVTDVCRVMTRDLAIDGSTGSGQIRLHLPRLFLGPGTFTLTVMVAREGYYESEAANTFYTINPAVYCCLARILEFEVIDAGVAVGQTGVMAEGEWSCTARDDAAFRGIALAPFKRWGVGSAHVAVEPLAGGGVRVVGDDSPFGYQLVSPPVQVPPGARMHLTLPMEAESGRQGIGVLDAHAGSWLVSPTSEAMSVAFDSGDNEQVFVVVTNNMPEGEGAPSRFVLHPGFVTVSAGGAAAAVAASTAADVAEGVS